MNYRFALRPAWLASHALVLVLVVLFVNLGFWQLRRLDERRAFNDMVQANATADPIALAAALSDGAASADGIGELVFRPVTVEGRYRRGSDVLVANRALDGQPGYWLVTPLEPSDGSSPVAVVRGFVTRGFVAEGEAQQLAPVDDNVFVTGYVQEPRTGGRFARDLPDGAPAEISNVDLGELGEQWGSALAPLWIQLRDQQPGDPSDLVVPVPLPDLDEGPHLGYAVQWFIFATIAVIGYPLILRRNARARSETAG